MRKLLVLGICLTFGTFAGVARAGPGPEPQHPVQRVIQRTGLTVSGSVRMWESRPIAGTVFVALREEDGGALRQTALGRCGAMYLGRGVVARVRLLGCSSDAANPVRVSLVSFSGPRRLSVIVSRDRLIG